MEFEYFKTSNINIGRDYSEIGDDNIRELVSEVEITKLVSLRYFDT